MNLNEFASAAMVAQLERVKRDADALYDDACRRGFAVLDDTKKKCNELVEEAAKRGALERTQRRRDPMLAIFIVGVFLSGIAFGILLGRLH
jgi:hypothetical protein